MKLFKPFAVVLTAALLFAGGVRSQAVTLADLINHTNGSNGTITSGDKVFSGFSYSVSGTGLVDASNVNVNPITLNGNFGLQFQAGWNNPNSGTTTDALLGFVVTAPGPLIVDDELLGNPYTLAGSGTNSLTGSVSIVETAINPSNVTISSLSIQDSAVYNPTTGNTTHTTISDDHSLFSATPYTSLTISKDMQFRNGGLEPTLSYVDQTFSQVPEPGVLGMLLSSGIAGSLFLLRRKA
jgi:hypothetical protein